MGDLHGVRGPAHWQLTLEAARTAVLLSVLFIVLYGGTNWFTAQRPAEEIGAWYFAWEPAVIPYVPLLIVPYMSIDLFFFFAAFLCRDERELRVFAQRIVFAILVASTFFLLLPLKLAWPPRPHAGGWFGDLVEASVTAPFLMEYPHNLFPTLHIALCMIVADVYARHTRGLVTILLQTWFILIAASTLLTWQHHLIDVAGGIVLGAFAFYCFREESPRLPVVRNVRVGGYYAAGAIGVACLVPALWPWGAFLLWPTAALGLVATAYFGLGPGIFHKTEGCLPLSTRFVFAPILLGQRLTLAYYRRRCRACDEAAPNVLIGRILSDAEATAAIQQGVTAVLDLTAEFAEAGPFRALTYCNVPILDLTAPTQAHVQETVQFISEEAAKGKVYVHCKIGYSRSAAIVGAYLVASGEAVTVEEALQRLRTVRPSIVIRPEAERALRRFANERRSLSPPDCRLHPAGTSPAAR